MKMFIWALVTALFSLCSAMPALSTGDPAGVTTRTVHLKELWRIGGDSEAEGETFGNIYDLTVDAEGNVYILDGQAVEVRMFSPDGSYVRSFGREGEGPGEFRYPMGVVTLPDKRIAVYQNNPPRLVAFDREGNSVDVGLEFDPAHPIQFLSNVQCAKDSIVVTGMDIRSSGQVQDRITRTIRFDTNGKFMCELEASTKRLEFAKPVTSDERATYVRCSSSGTAYIADSWNYRIAAYPPDCRSQRKIARNHEHRRRTGEEIAAIESYYRRGGGTQGVQLDISKNDPDVRWMGVDGSDRLWVLPSTSENSAEKNRIGRFDVYNAGDGLIASVDLGGEASGRDRYFLRGNRFFVVHVPATDEADLEPTGVTCYQLPVI